MSFWPFYSSFGSHSQLQKFLDSVLDITQIAAENLLDDHILQLEFIDELKSLSSKYGDNHNLLLPQVQQNESETKAPKNNNNSDAASVSSNNDSPSSNSSKNARETKLVQIVLQPHVLMGFIDNIFDSVDFFHERAAEDQEKLDRIIERIDSGDPAEDSSDEEDDNLKLSSSPSSSKQDDNYGESKEDYNRRCIQCSADVLSTDFWMISNRVIKTPKLMSRLWLVLSSENLRESSPSVSYMVQILDHLMETNSIELLNFIRRQEDLVDTFLAKIEIPILMDFFLKIIQTDRADSPTGILEVLAQQNLIQKLINILRPNAYPHISNSQRMFKQTAATEFIKALISISSNTTLAIDLDTNIGPNQLTRELASPKIINQMIHDIILCRVPSDSSPGHLLTNKIGISNCVTILIELIRKNNSDYDLNCGSYSTLLQNSNGENTGEVNIYVMFQWLKDFDQNPPGARDPVYLGDMLTLFSDNLDAVALLIESDSSRPVMANENTEALGITKFKVFELIAELLHCSNMILLNSCKVADIIHLRDEIRDLQHERIQSALSDSIFDNFEADREETDRKQISSVTSGMDDVSLHDVSPSDKDKAQYSKSQRSNLNSSKNIDDVERSKLDAVRNYEFVDSEDDEPAVSSENPFVTEERDALFRAKCSAGDYFKIKLLDLKILESIINKLEDYPWHNFFHNVVFDLIQQIFNGKLNSYNSFLIVNLFRKDKCDLTGLVVNAFRHEADPRPGYMGHLVLISEEVVKFTSLYKPSLISSVIVNSVESQDWSWFVDNVLLKTRELYNVILGADPDYDDDEDQHEEDVGHTSNHKDDEYFGFDSSTVGHMDLEPYENDHKNIIILGDSNNHDEFVNQKNYDDDDKLNDEIAEVRIQNMSPKAGRENEELIYRLGGHKYMDDQEHYEENDFLDNISGSSSSDEESDDENELRRVPKHYE